MFEKVECGYPALKAQVQCGFLLVPLDHENPERGGVRLAVTIIKALGKDPAADPVVYLAGGPGDSATQDVASWLNQPFLQKRDLILVDQRGAGRSTPDLNCPEMDNPVYTDELQVARACRARLLEQKVDFTLFNSAQSAADINALMHALGYKEWNLLGVSYGTRLALTILRDFPHGIRSVILDSTYPPQVDAYEEQAINGNRAVQAVFKACLRDKKCAYTYPDLKMVFYQLLNELEQHPAELKLVDPGSGQMQQVTLDGYTLVNIVIKALYKPVTLSFVPYAIYQASYGNFEALKELVNTFQQAALQPTAQAAISTAGVELASSEGLYYSVECREEIPFNDIEKAREAVSQAQSPVADLLFEDVNSLFDVCAIWGAGKAGDVETQPVKSDVPALVLSGEFDPITPPNWGKIATRDLQNGFYFMLPALGHANLQNDPCPANMVADFLDSPDRPPEAACLNSLKTEFYIP
jgi:pimeloyl-ACP methyl ester carboxylesterase